MISCKETKSTYTSKFLGYFKFEKFITNCGECENNRKRSKSKTNAICNKIRILHFFISKLSSCVPSLVVTKLKVHKLGNSLCSSSLNILLQIATNVKIFENLQKARQYNL